jgi:hypothetical protein
MVSPDSHTAMAAELAGQAPDKGEAPSPTDVSDLLATADGQALFKAFMRINDKSARRSIVRLLEAVIEVGSPLDRGKVAE